jgi:hypothetical protein
VNSSVCAKSSRQCPVLHLSFNIHHIVVLSFVSDIVATFQRFSRLYVFTKLRS